MRKNFTLLVGSLCLAMVLPSCSKEVESAPQPTVAAPASVINAAILTGESYSLSFDASEEVSIQKQAAHYLESVASLNNETGKIVYRYTPAAGYAGQDEVTLAKTVKVYGEMAGEHRCGGSSMGQGSDSYTRTLVTVRFNVK